MVWFWYIDDIFYIWTHGEQELQWLLQELNKTHPNLKFTHESSKEKISFLDLCVSLYDGNLYTDLHIKATDCHEYLEYMSSHSEHIKKSIICSQIFRLSRLFSFQQEFECHKRNLRSWFVKRRYSEEIIDKEMLKVKFNFPKKINPKDKEEKGFSLVVTCETKYSIWSAIPSHFLKAVFHKIYSVPYQPSLNPVYMNDEVKKVFSPKPMISFRSARKLSSYLVRAKLYPTEITAGSFKCTKKRCEVCKTVNMVNCNLM